MNLKTKNVLNGVKESCENVEISCSYESILEMIKGTNLSDEESVQNTFQKMNFFFSQNSLNDTELSEEYINTVLSLMQPSNGLDVARYGTICFYIMIHYPNLVTDFPFLERVLPSLTAVLEISDDVITSHVFLILTKLALPSVECVNAVMETVSYEIIDRIIKTSSNLFLIGSAMKLYSMIFKVYGNDNPQCNVLLPSAFSCIEYAIHNILPTPESTEVSDEEMPILIDALSFLLDAGSNEVWDYCFKESSLLPYCNEAFLRIRKTTLRLLALKLIRRIGKNTLIERSKINYPRVYELMHHPVSSISQAALNCIIHIHPADLQKLIEETDLIQHITDLIVNGSLQVKKTCINFLLRRENISWVNIYSDELVVSLWELFSNTDNESEKDLKNSIAKCLIKIISSFSAVDEEKTEQIKDMLREANAEDIISEYIQEYFIDSVEINQLYSLIEDVSSC